MSAPYAKFLLTSVVVIGGAWAAYCVSPAGAAEREQTRRQKDMARQFPNESINKSAQKRSTV